MQPTITQSDPLALDSVQGAVARTVTGTGFPVLGKTLPALLMEAAERYATPRALNHRRNGEWKAFSLDAVRTQSSEIALGLVELGLRAGDRVALYMESDAYFCLADFGCQIGGFADVPVYLNQALETNRFILNHSEARVLFVSSLRHLADLRDVIVASPHIETVVVAEVDPAEKMIPVPEGVRWMSLDALLKRGQTRLQADPGAVKALVDAVNPHDLATIVYTSGTTGQPKGVMLSHENISSNAMTAVEELGDYRSGPDGEVSLSFLPLTHIFARTLLYAMLGHGTPIYFSDPDALSADLLDVKPTLMASVPRVLEKVYGKILKKAANLEGIRKKLLTWSLDLARQYELGVEPVGTYRFRLKLADLLVYGQWREALGGRIRYLISGGAALNPDLANLFAAGGVVVLQGYGLTETSPIIAFNRPRSNRAGTVGTPLPGVDVRIADDGEILTRGPHVMMGYYKNPEKTDEVIDEEGWFHTGDVGELTAEGALRITDRKKDLFKLSTGKYVMPQPLENRLATHPLIEQAVVVGAGHKFCTVLLFIDPGTLRVLAETRGLDLNASDEALLAHPVVVDRVRGLIKEANAGMDPWSTIKRFILLSDALTVENGMLTPSMKVKRARVREAYDAVIRSLYDGGGYDVDPAP